MSKHERDVESYVDGVISGRIVTGRLVRLAVWRYLDDLKLARSRGFEFKKEFAEEFLDFSEMCCHTQGEWAGKPFISEPWQKFCDWNIFGWRVKTTGTRRFQKTFEELGRKNGKTTRCGPKCYYLPLMDNPIEEGAQGYCVATKEKQAHLLFDEIKRCREKSPALKNYCQAFQRRITFPSTQSYMDVLGSDSDTQDGFNPHFIVRDELHAWRERHRGLAEKLDTGFGARRQPLMMTITTAGDDKSCIWIEDHEYAVRTVESVITGDIVDDSLFAFMANLDMQETPCFRCKGKQCPWCGGTGIIPKDDPFDEGVWIKANPNLGISVKLDQMRKAANEAKNKPTALNKFLRYNCNVRVSALDKLISAEAWNACKGELSDWSSADRIHGGVDLGRSNDMAGTAILARFDMVDDAGAPFSRYEIQSNAWTCEDRDEDVQTPQVANWVREGLLEECSGDQVLFSDIEDWIVSQSAIHGVRTWAYDPAFGPMLGQRLQEVHGLKVFPFSQNPFRYNAPTRHLERLLTEVHIVNGNEVRALCHDGDPVLAWMMTNLIVRKNAKDEWMPDKGSSQQKIDIAVSVLMALSECCYSGEGSSVSIYETPGNLSL